MLIWLCLDADNGVQRLVLQAVKPPVVGWYSAQLESLCILPVGSSIGLRSKLQWPPVT